MGFNSGFKGLIYIIYRLLLTEIINESSFSQNTHVSVQDVI